jgi:hypothetical protein
MNVLFGYGDTKEQVMNTAVEMSEEELVALPVGTTVSYGIFSNISYGGIVTHREDGRPYQNVHVKLVDRHGNEKLVFASLFRKNVKIKG